MVKDFFEIARLEYRMELLLFFVRLTCLLFAGLLLFFMGTRGAVFIFQWLAFLGLIILNGVSVYRLHTLKRYLDELALEFPDQVRED